MKTKHLRIEPHRNRKWFSILPVIAFKREYWYFWKINLGWLWWVWTIEFTVRYWESKEIVKNLKKEPEIYIISEIWNKFHSKYY